MKNFTKKFFGIFLCIAMTIAILPFNAIAVENTQSDSETVALDESNNQDLSDKVTVQEGLPEYGSYYASEQYEEELTEKEQNVEVPQLSVPEVASNLETEELEESVIEAPVLLGDTDLGISTTEETIIHEGTCGYGKSIHWTINDKGDFKISCPYTSSDSMSGVGSVEDVPWYAYREEIKTVAIENINIICAHAFEGCVNLTDVKGSAKNNGVPDYCFKDCVQLKKVELSQVDKNMTGSISYHAFENCSELEEIVIPEGFKNISDDAFKNCSKLSNISLPSSIESVVLSAFEGTPWLEQQGDMVIVGAVLLKYCGIAENVSIPDGIKTIADNAFSQNETLKNVLLPESLEKIGMYAFKDCKSLTEIIIPIRVKEVGYEAFAYCENLENVTIKNASCQIGKNAFAGTLWEKNQGDYFVIDGTLVKYNGDKNAIDFSDCKETITKIGESAFSYNSTVESIILPDSVTNIGGSAFYGCINLKSVILPSKLNTMGYSCFTNCSSLETIAFPESLVEIPGQAFAGCEKLNNIVIPKSVSQIGYYAFDNCTNLSDVVFEGTPDNVSSDAFRNTPFSQKDFFIIGKKLFSYNGTASKVVVPDSVYIIGDNAFANNTNIEEIVLPDNVWYLGYGVFQNCTNLKKINFPKSLENLGVNVFDNCSSLTEVIIPDNFTLSTSNLSFNNCKSLKSFTVPQGVRQVSFSGCTGLENVSLPEGLIGGGFKNCSSLKEITLPYTVTSIRVSDFEGCSSLTSIVIPNGVKNILGKAFSNCTSLQTVKFPAKIEFIDKTAFEGTPWLAAQGDFLVVNGVLISYIGTDTSIIVPDTVKEIGASAFNGNAKIESVTIPSSVKKIGKYAFLGCRNLSAVSLQEGVEEIGLRAFYNCPLIKEIILPSGFKKIDARAFQDCALLSNIVLPESIEFIGPFALDGTPWIETQGDFVVLGNRLISYQGTETHIQIPDSVTVIGGQAFRGLPITEISIPSSVESIGDYAFAECNSLESIVIPDSVAVVEYRAFSSCKNLKEVALPGQLEKINSYTFFECENLTKVQMPKSLKSIEDLAFYNCLNLIDAPLSEGIVSVKPGAFSNCVKWNVMPEDVPESLSDFAVDSFMNTPLLAELNKNEFAILNGNLLQYNGSATELTIPDSVKYVQSYFLQDRSLSTSITKIAFPESFMGCDFYAFSNLDSLREVVLPESLTTIPGGFCSQCVNLTSINIPENVSKVEYRAFYGCTNLDISVLPEKLAEIGDGAFYGCKKNDAITIPQSVNKMDGKSIGYQYDGNQGRTKKNEDMILSVYRSTEGERYALSEGFSVNYLSCEHSKISKIAAKEPTATANGNILYYVCDICGQAFKDQDGLEPIEKEDYILEAKKIQEFDQVDTSEKEKIPEKLVEAVGEDALKDLATSKDKDVVIKTAEKVSELEVKMGVETKIEEAPGSYVPIDISQVESVGMAMNGATTLIIGEAEKPEDFENVKIVAGKSIDLDNGIAFSMELIGPNGKEINELQVPIWVTIPIPAGLSTKDLYIIHIHGKDKEVLKPIVSEDGKSAIVAITGFSDFMFANAEKVTEFELGDVDKNRSKEAADVTALARHVAKITQTDDLEGLSLCDVNGDGIVSAEDVTHLARFIAKIIGELDGDR